MPNPESVPLQSAGHITLDSEWLQYTNLLQASATDGGLWPEQRFYRTVDQVFQTQTVLQNDNTFVIPVVANAQYTFYGWFIYSSNSTAFMKCAWTMPAGTTGFWTTQAYGPAVVASPGLIDSQLVGLGTVKNLGVAGASTTSMSPMGNIIVGSTPGNVVFQFAQVASTAVNTGMRAGAWLSATRQL